jgi:hypothetical protein
MTHRERYFSFATDGIERTACEIAPLLNLNNPALVTQCLTRMKMTLVQERSDWKLLKIMPDRRNGAVKWKLEKRVKF